MADWMKTLSEHYEWFRRERRGDLIIVFDIDGTIFDLRHTILYILKSFDRAHDTAYFKGLTVNDIRMDEDDVEVLLRSFNIPDNDKYRVLSWYMTRRWSSYCNLQSAYPVRGVFEVIRWFQLQPRTFVGLNTSRPEALRTETLRLLNRVGREFKVGFPSELLYMNHSEWSTHVPSSKVAGVRYFKGSGYQVFAMVDNELPNLEAIAKEFPDEGILLLHANTVRESVRRVSIAPPVRGAEIAVGSNYELSQLVPQGELPSHVQFIWRRVSTKASLDRFLQSNITWADVGVRFDPEFNRLVVTDPRRELDGWQEIPPCNFETLLSQLQRAGRSVRLDLEDGTTIDRVLGSIHLLGIPETQLSFHGTIERLGEHGIRRLRASLPEAIIECPIDFLSPLVQACPAKAQEILNLLQSWGVTRFSLSWLNEERHLLLERLESWGFAVSIHSVFDLESFLQAVLLLPRAIVCDFDTSWFQLPLAEEHHEPQQPTGKDGHFLSGGAISRDVSALLPFDGYAEKPDLLQ